MLEEEMVASYELRITGIQRTKTEMQRLDQEIANLRAGQYSSGSNVTGAGRVKGFNTDIFVQKIEQLEGRVQTKAEKAMLDAMNLGKEIQGKALQAAVTDYGEERMKRRQGHSAGRDDAGEMIKAISRNVEVSKTSDTTTVTGWHGWKEDHPKYFDAQERGSRGGGGKKGGMGSMGRKKTRGKGASGGIKAANSLGAAIPIVRETLRAELRGLK